MGVVIVEGEGAVFGEVNLGGPIVINGAFATRSSQITFDDLLLTLHEKVKNFLVIHVYTTLPACQILTCSLNTDWHILSVSP